MLRFISLALLGLTLAGCGGDTPNNTDLTIATVNNGDMVRMQRLSEVFAAQNPDVNINWVVLEENILRQKVTTDIATRSGQYDIITIGTYETPIWSQRGWLASLDNLPADYDVDDILPSIRQGVSLDDELYAAPFYGESSMLIYRTDLIEKAGLTMPTDPSWDFVTKAAAAMTDKSAGIYGMCLRGKAGWGENMALITAMSNSFGARWFDEYWKPQFNSPEWAATLNAYLDLMTNYGPPGASSNGFNENLSLFQQGKCAMWIDATVAGSFVTNTDESVVADKVGFALAPDNGLGPRANWLWAWSLAIPSSSKNKEAAKAFIAWSTSKEYLQLVASEDGWANVPPGTRQSLYDNPEYKDVPFAQTTLNSIQAANPNAPTVKPVPYTGVQFVAIPEFQAIATRVGQQFSSALAGTVTADEALVAAQSLTDREMSRAGYYKK